MAAAAKNLCFIIVFPIGSLRGHSTRRHISFLRLFCHREPIDIHADGRDCDGAGNAGDDHLDGGGPSGDSVCVEGELLKDTSPLRPRLGTGFLPSGGHREQSDAIYDRNRITE